MYLKSSVDLCFSDKEHYFSQTNHVMDTQKLSINTRLKNLSTDLNDYADRRESRTFVPTDIRSLTIFDRAGHSCSYQITTPDIRAHINFISFIYSLHAYPLLLIA